MSVTEASRHRLHHFDLKREFWLLERSFRKFGISLASQGYLNQITYTKKIACKSRRSVIRGATNLNRACENSKSFHSSPPHPDYKGGNSGGADDLVVTTVASVSKNIEPDVAA
jgi:hypothetical protein